MIDYLAVESLFTLFARILPSTGNVDSGRAKRSDFIKDVFLLPSFENGEKMAQVLEDVSTSAWEDTLIILINLLANGRIEL